MREILIPANERVETGAVKFYHDKGSNLLEEDWPGLFVRGDDAFALSLAIDSLLHDDKDSASFFLARKQIEQLGAMIREEVVIKN